MTPLSTMSAGEFSVAYLGVSAIILMLGWAWSKMVDTSMRGSMPRVDGPLDPQELAYMADGVEGVARLVLHDMVARGYLDTRVEESVFKKEQLVCPPKAVKPLSYLTPLEREVVQAVDRPVGADELMSRALLERVAPFCAQIEARLVRDGLVFNDAERGLRRNVWYVGIVALLVVATTRFVATFSDAAPDTSWLAVSVITSVVIVALGAITAQRRQTRLGERWLAAVQVELGELRAMRAHRGLMTGRNALLLLAVFGPRREAFRASGKAVDAARD
jgi:uncharacterized protein (TIGR04222 family)